MSEATTDPETDRRRSNGRHPGGRPRLPDTERAILKAVGELMAEQGVSGTTINAVAARSGVARGTVYRRWPNRSAMIAAAVRAPAAGSRSSWATTSRSTSGSRPRRRAGSWPSRRSRR
jgi:AcrR family transcriptional regulator